MVAPNDDPRWRYASTARWFAGKGRGGVARRIEALDWYRAPEPGHLGVRSEIITIAYPDGAHDYYHLPISYRTAPLSDALIGPADDPQLGYPHDATRDPEAMELLIASLGRRVNSGDWSAMLPRGDRLTGPMPARPFTGEQSNSTVFLGSTALVKFFRHLEVGNNVDIPLHEALGRYRVRDVDELYGWVTAHFRAISGRAVHADLLMITEQLKTLGEGWPMAVESATADTDFSAHAAGIGRALAHVHLALVQAFPPVMLKGDDVADGMVARLDRAIEAVPALSDYRSMLVVGFNRLRGHRLPAQRVHGDFHLGQTLLTPGGWRIIDFEGEPLRPLADRTLPDSVWRDVAGMVRSLGYAAAQDGSPDAPARQHWLQRSQAAFIAAYLEITGVHDQVDLLDAYVADKAIYEVVYETRNRPDWVHIPMAAITSWHEHQFQAPRGRTHHA